MKIVIMGGSGFIGSFIAQELSKDESNEVIIFDLENPKFELKRNMHFKEGDIKYFQNVLDVTKDADEVYDVAGLLGTAELMEINQRAVDTNIRGAVNVLEACKRNNVKRVFHPTKPNDWLNTYSITKFAAEQFCLLYQRNYNMNISVLKWFNAYGPRQHYYPIRKMIPMFILQALHNKPIQIFGDGSQTVDLIYAGDIAKIAIESTRKLGHIGKILDVGSGMAVSVKEAAEKIIKMTNSKSTLEFLPMRIGEPEKSHIVADVVDLKKHLDIPLTSFEEGMKPTIEYYKNTSEKLVKEIFKFYNIK